MKDFTEVLREAGKRILFVLLGSTAIGAFLLALVLAGGLLAAIGKFVNAHVFHFKYLDGGDEFLFGILTLMLTLCVYHVGKLIYKEGLKK
jgi:hypothetical protein